MLLKLLFEREKKKKMENEKKYNYNYIFFKATTKIGMYANEEIEAKEMLTDVENENVLKSLKIFLKTKLMEKSVVMHGSLEIMQDNLSSQIPFAIYNILIKSEVQKDPETQKEITINYVLCLSLEVKSWNLLGLFLADLGSFCKSFRDAYLNNKSNEELTQILGSWPNECVFFI